MANKQIRFLGILLFCLLIVYCFVRDMRIERQYTSDLRNRIVGARLQADGRSPYFYKWQNGDGVRYYDPANFDSLKVSNITASPFLHQMFYPIRNFQQRTISLVWLSIEYVMFLLMIAFGLSCVITNAQFFLILTISCLLLFTDAWMEHIANGQVYIMIPFFSILFYIFLNKKHTFYYFLAGVCAIVLVLIRPTYLFFMLPFFMLFFKMKRIDVIAFFLPIILMLILLVSSKKERFLWKDYKEGLSEQMLVHQGLHPTIQINFPKFTKVNWEGWEQSDIQLATFKYAYKPKSVNGNFFAFYKILFRKKIPVSILNILAISSILFLFGIFIFQYFEANNKPSLLLLSLVGFGLYMISDFLSPIHRHQYNAVLWLFPLLLIALNQKAEWSWLMVVLILSLVININAFGFITLPHVVGEYIMWLVLLIICIKEFKILRLE